MIMLTIRPGQLATLDADARARFVSKLVPMLMARHPELSDRPESELRAEVSAYCDTAAEYDIRAQNAVGDFVDLSLQIGSRFHEHPLVKRVLTDPAVPPDRRIAALMQTLTPAEWTAVRQFATEA